MAQRRTHYRPARSERPPQPTGAGKAAGRAGFSMVELLIVGAVLASLAALGGFAYQTYLRNVKLTIGDQQRDRITEQVDSSVGLVSRGADAGLRSTVTGYPITDMSTCGEFLDALKIQLQNLSNPYDGSPAVTFYSGYSWQQKRGKIRITCYRMHDTSPSNGRQCKMKDAGIRVTYYRYDCGGRCGDPLCQFPAADCGDHTPGVWVTAGQQDIFYGKVDRVNVLHDNGTVKEAPWGGPLADFAWAEAQCPGYTMSSVARETDY